MKNSVLLFAFFLSITTRAFSLSFATTSDGNWDNLTSWIGQLPGTILPAEIQLSGNEVININHNITANGNITLSGNNA